LVIGSSPKNAARTVCSEVTACSDGRHIRKDREIIETKSLRDQGSRRRSFELSGGRSVSDQHITRSGVGRRGRGGGGAPTLLLPLLRAGLALGSAYAWHAMAYHL
jgi:hypothetical protein